MWWGTIEESSLAKGSLFLWVKGSRLELDLLETVELPNPLLSVHFLVDYFVTLGDLSVHCY